MASIGTLAAVWGQAQYPGQVAKSSKASPELRSIAVLEWTGEEGKPKASRIVPVTVLDGGELRDGAIYLARPQPMALGGGVEYELQENGKAIGLFEIQNAGQVQGSWVGFGSWKPLPAPKVVSSAPKIDNQEESDRPVLHRKKQTDNGKGGGAAQTESSEPASPADPDRPTLHKKEPGGKADADSNSSASPDADRPTVHPKSADGTSASGTPGGAGVEDPDRPKLKKNKQKPAEDIGRAEVIPDVTDPDRPKLKRGKSSGDSLEVAPSLMGMPADLQQAVAVSDSKFRPEHPWTYSWANAGDEEKMKSALEDMAREALGLKPPAAKPAPTPRRTATRKAAKPPAPPPPLEPMPLEGEQFRVFELAYGSGATMVLTAHTDGPLAQQKFVTLVAQPDLYGNVQVLLKSVTDGAHLDDKPRMRLVDAVDAMADNRGELLFELRGDTQRQFALYRVLRGHAEKLFVGGGGDYGAQSRN